MRDEDITFHIAQPFTSLYDHIAATTDHAIILLLLVGVTSFGDGLERNTSFALLPQENNEIDYKFVWLGVG